VLDSNSSFFTANVDLTNCADVTNYVVANPLRSAQELFFMP